jgi:F-box-like
MDTRLVFIWYSHITFLFLIKIILTSEECPTSLSTTPNVHQTVHCLPTELLQMIFRILAQYSILEPGGDCHTYNKSTILATHVSRRWRHVAFGDPFLWSSIPVATSHPYSIEYFQAFIDRSQSHRLAIDICHKNNDDNYQRLRTILDTIYLHGNRLGEFSMSGCESIIGLLQEKLSFPASVLETLKFLNSPQASPYSWTFGNMFMETTPILRHLTLSGWSDWLPPYTIFHNITYLALSSERMVFIPLSSLVELLAQCSGLKHLVLRFLYPRLSSPDTRSSLNHLETLLLDRCDSEAILSRLILPSNLNVTIWEDPESLSVMSMPSDCSRVHSLDDIIKAHLVINLEDMTLTAYNRNGSHFEWSQVAYLDSVDGEYDDIIISSVRHLLRNSIPGFVPFSGIQEFAIYCEKFEPDAFVGPNISWNRVFRDWAVLTTLTIFNFPIEEVMMALIPSNKTFDSIVCPQLDVIQLQIPEANVEMFKILTNLFTARDRRGCRISSLKMRMVREDYRTYKDEIMALKDCVQNMHVQRL